MGGCLETHTLVFIVDLEREENKCVTENAGQVWGCFNTLFFFETPFSFKIYEIHSQRKSKNQKSKINPQIRWFDPRTLNAIVHLKN